jgi:hypothetical protein
MLADWVNGVPVYRDWYFCHPSELEAKFDRGTLSGNNCAKHMASKLRKSRPRHFPANSA